MEEARSAFNISTGKRTGKGSLGKPRHKWENNIRMNLNLLSAYDVISGHTDVIMQWPGRLITSCSSSGLTRYLFLRELSEC